MTLSNAFPKARPVEDLILSAEQALAWFESIDDQIAAERERARAEARLDVARDEALLEELEARADWLAERAER